MCMFKKKIIITHGAAPITRIGHFQDNRISYKESANNFVNLTLLDDGIKIEKKGQVNLMFVHKEGETKRLSYELIVNGQKFSGTSVIKTQQVIVNNDQIIVKYLRDDELVVMEIKIIN